MSIPTRIGQYTHGGYFSGFIRDTLQIRAIIVAPGCAMQSNILLQNDTTPIGLTSYSYGKPNTSILAANGSNIAIEIQSLVINNTSDWYIPAVSEAMSTVRYLKPITTYRWGLRQTRTPTHHQNGVERYNQVAVPPLHTSFLDLDHTLVTKFQFKPETYRQTWYFTSTEALFDADDSVDESSGYLELRTEPSICLAVISYLHGTVHDSPYNNYFKVRPVRSVVVVK